MSNIVNQLKKDKESSVAEVKAIHAMMESSIAKIRVSIYE